MQAAVLSIGTELTRGELVNTNATWLAVELTAAGFTVAEVLTIDDDRGRIISALRGLASRGTKLVVCTGGLGPTTDDLTTETVASMLNVALVRDAASIAEIEARFARLNRTMSTSNTKQADFPVGADILPNPHGTAPGFMIRVDAALCAFMPGVPSEMKPMFRDQVTPRISALATRTTYQVHLRTFGLPESQVGERLAGIEAEFPGVILGYRAHFPEIEVKVFAQANTEIAAKALAESAAAQVRIRLANVIYGGVNDTYASVTVRELCAAGLSIGIAESCTGGQVAQLLTAIPGSSKTVQGSIVAYANSAKEQLLGVDPTLIEAHGAVSSQVAAAMANGARAAFGADIGVAITGIAGPGGGTAEKPVGTVHLAISTANGTETRSERFAWDRDKVQLFATYIALSMVRKHLAART
jgi:nicotinamide-nucleotide amidase